MTDAAAHDGARLREGLIDPANTAPNCLKLSEDGQFEGFFAEMARGDFRILEDMETVNRIAARYHITFTGPPL